MNVRFRDEHSSHMACIGNAVINLGVTNAKLYHRAVSIISSVTSCSADLAVAALLRAIYHVDPCSTKEEVPSSPTSLDTLIALPVSVHVRAAATQQDLVPVAILLAEAAASGRNLSEQGAIAVLRGYPVLRRALKAALP